MQLPIIVLYIYDAKDQGNPYILSTIYISCLVIMYLYSYNVYIIEQVIVCAALKEM